MTFPDSPRPPATAAPVWPEDLPPTHQRQQPAGPQIRAVDGNRAALMLLVMQNVASALMIRFLGLGLGLTLLLTFLLTALVGWLLFRPALSALLADMRWRTRPSVVMVLGGFGLAFVASRAFASAYVTLVPSAAASVPQFLSHGLDLYVLVLSAGLLIPFAEEVAFRGLMMRGQESAAGFTVAALATSFAFGLAHGVPASIVGILPLAYVLARVVQHSGSLWNSVIIHALNNTLSVVLAATLARSRLVRPDVLTELMKNEFLRLTLAGGVLLLGVATLAVAHLWLVPRPDPTVSKTRGPWLTGAYVAVVIFGLLAVISGLPPVQDAMLRLRDSLRRG